MLVSEEFSRESSRLDRNAGCCCMFKGFAFQRFELYQIEVACLAASGAVFAFWGPQTSSGQSVSRKPVFFLSEM